MLSRALSRPARLMARMMALFALVVSAHAAPPTDAASLAPARSFLVVSVPNFKTLSETFKKTDLGKLWDEPGVHDFVGEVSGDFTKSISEFMKSVDPNAKEFSPPEGLVGMALFFPEKGAKTADGAPKKSGDPCMLVVADMGERAGDYEQFLERAVDRGVSDKKITREQDTYQGVPVTVIRPVVDEEAARKRQERLDKMRRGEDVGEDDAAEDPPKGSDVAAWIGGTPDDRRDVRVARVENIFLACTEQHAFEEAIDALKGKDIDSAADAPAFKQSLEQHPGGELAYAVVRIEPLLARLSGDAEDEADGPSPAKALEALGITSVKAVSLGLHLGMPDGMVDVSFGALAPEKKGLLSLFTTPAGAFEPPVFVPGDSASVARFTFDFPRLFEVLRGALATFPQDVRSQAAPELEMARDMTNPAFQVMGPVVHLVTSYTKPLSAESSEAAWAIDVRDQDAVTTAIAGISAKAQGMLEQEDFEGNTIYKSALGGVSLGVGFNHLFIGSGTAVRSAMRLAGRKDGEGATLAADARFKSDIAALSPGAIMYSWTDMEQTLRYQYWALKNQASIMEQQLTDYGLDAEQRAKYMKHYKDQQGAWVDKLPDIESILPHLGNTATEVRSTPEGFRGRMLMLKPSEKK